MEKTQRESDKRVEVLMLCVCIASTWTLFLGVELEKAGKRGEVDRANKPQLSLFQFVIRYLKHLLARGEPLPSAFRLST